MSRPSRPPKFGGSHLRGGACVASQRVPRRLAATRSSGTLAPKLGGPGGPLFLLLLLLLTGCAAPHTFTIGSKRFPESNILGEMVRLTAQNAGETGVTHKQGLGNTGIVFAALQRGDIDVYPEYTGTISQELLKDKGAVTLAQINRELAPQGLAAGVPLGFNNGYGFAMREQQAQKLGIRTLSDLAAHPDLRLGLSQEFIKRTDGWPGVKSDYHLPFVPQGFDHGAAYQSVGAGRVDVVDVYTTDAEIQKYGLRVLTDDRHFFPNYDAVLLYRSDVPRRFPQAWAAIQKLSGTIPDRKMIALNADASIKQLSPASIAQNFLAARGVGKSVNAKRETFWSLLFGPDFWPETVRHLELVFVSLLLSVAVGVPLGIWAARKRGAAGPILGTTGIIQTLPSLALLALFVPLFGIGLTPAIVALFLYSLLPVVRNTYTGLTEIAPSLKESALALGLSPFARLRLIELPLASRSILAGIKTAAVINVGTATIAAFIGAGGYGDRISQGLSTVDNATILAGVVPSAALALLVQGGFDLLDRALVPAGLRK